MALTSALFTGLSGLNVNQTRLNVVGNNIANANTVAFKSSRAMFAPQFYITDAAGGPPTNTFGGENPSQRGLGATVAAIQKDFTQGSLETTGKGTDMAIDGNGFFIVQGEERAYTRDGSFTLNTNNELVTNRGDFVMGFAADENGTVIKGPLTRLQVPNDAESQAQATENVTIQGNFNADGDVSTGASVLASPALQLVGGGAIALTTTLDNVSLDGTTPLFNGTTPDTLTLAAKKGGRSLPELKFEITPTSTVQDLLDFYNQGLQIKTDEPPTGTYTPGASLDVGTGVISITGNVGKENALSLGGTAFTSTNAAMTLGFADAPDSNAVGESVTTSFEVYDSLGTPVTIDVTATLVAKTDTGTEWKFIAASPENTKALTYDPTGTDFTGAILGSGTLTFDSKGKLTSSTGTSVTLDRSATGAFPQQAINMDFSSMTALTTLDSDMVMDNQDGFATGLLNGFAVGPNGVITGTFSNGQTRTLGQLAVAQFDNPEGLVDQGSNLYAPGANSGTPTIGAPLDLNAGAVRSGSLELSNVDLSREFINLIISSTGFTAASRVITTSDQLLTELLNTSR